jgi:hypothetical protein
MNWPINNILAVTNHFSSFSLDTLLNTDSHFVRDKIRLN